MTTCGKFGLVYCSGLAGAGVVDWREHVEWLDGNKEDSGDTNRIYLHFFFNESCRKMVSSSRSRHKNREC